MFSGFTEDETLIGTQWFYAATDLFGVAKELWNILGPYALLQKQLSEITEDDIELSTEILNFYCGPFEDLSFKHYGNFTKILTDSFFWFGLNRFLDLHLEQALGSTYFYRLKYYVKSWRAVPTPGKVCP